MARKKARTRPTSLTLRLGLGKFFGAAVGGIIFFSLPALSTDVSLAMRFGMWGWYILLGAMIALAGVYTTHPCFKLRLPSLLRGAMIGFTMNLVLGALIYDPMLHAFSGYSDFHLSGSMPIIQVALEGLIWGALIDRVITFYAGEGKDLTKKL